jgi:hypothetical protein
VTEFSFANPSAADDLRLITTIRLARRRARKIAAIMSQLRDGLQEELVTNL